MDANRFDGIARLLAERRLSRRAAFSSAAGLMAALGLRQAAGAQVTQVQCGNERCKNDPGKCNDGCVCCIYSNGNSRCRPPGTCSPGTVACPVGTRICGNVCAECCSGSDCSDGNACTVDSCVGGVCRYEPVSCGDSNACTIDSCDPVLGCQHQPISCDDGNPCTDNTCNPATGCVSTPLSGSACVTASGGAGTCSSGTCVANPTTTTTTTSTTTPAPKPCTGCASSQTACLVNGSCADVCTTSFGCPFVCSCGYPSVEGPQYCLTGEGSCDGYAACSSTSQCPQGLVCQPVSCGDGTVTNHCVPLCTVT